MLHRRTQTVLMAISTWAWMSWVTSAAQSQGGPLATPEIPRAPSDPGPSGAGVEAKANLQLAVSSPTRSTLTLGAGHASPAELSLRQTQSNGLRSSVSYEIYSSITSVSDVGHRGARSTDTNHSTFSAHLGGGGNGLDAGVLVDVTHGKRWPALGSGLVVRGGARIRVEGNRAYYVSTLQIPMLDVGYQFAKPGILIEVSGRAGLLWDGRFRADSQTTRNLGFAPVGGAALDLGLTPVWASVRWLRSQHLSEFNLDFCSQPGQSIWSMCVRAVSTSEDVWPTASARRVLVGIFALGLAVPG